MKLTLTILFILLTIPFSRSAEDISLNSEKEQELNEIEKNLTNQKNLINQTEEKIQKLKETKAKTAETIREYSEKLKEIKQEYQEHSKIITQLEIEKKKNIFLLHQKKKLISQILATLQKIGSSPPPAVIVNSKDILTSLRSAMLLGSLTPRIFKQIKDLVDTLEKQKEIANLIELRKQKLEENSKKLEQENTKLTLLLNLRTTQVIEHEETLFIFKKQAIELAERSKNIKDLIIELDKKKLSFSDLNQKDQNSASSTLVAFTTLKQKLLWPTSGKIIKSYGQTIKNQPKENGITLETLENSIIIAPTKGRVVFAGTFRTYGNMIILSVGSNYYILIAGLNTLSVNVGQWVEKAQPLGETKTQISEGNNFPNVSKKKSTYLYIELRKHAIPIDPIPWWPKLR